MEHKEILSLKETAEYLKISPTTLWKYVRKNEIPGCKIGGQWRFKLSVLNQWLEG